MKEWNLPLAHLVKVELAGQFLLNDRDFAIVHASRTHALHLHGYAAEMVLAGRRIMLAPGDLTLSPAGLPSMYHLPRPGRHWCIHFHAGDDDGPFAPVALHLPGCAHLRDKFAHVGAQHATASDDIGFHAARVGAQDLLLLAARLSNPLPRHDAAAIAAQFIDDSFAQPIGVNEVATAAGRSPAYVTRMFRNRFGCTVMQRLLQRRAEHARFLLQSTDLPIWRIAERCGIADAQHFNKFVRKMFGCSPTALRARISAGAVDPDR